MKRRSPFDDYLRSGRRSAQMPQAIELKFNPNHDERGRFTFSGQGVLSGGGDVMRAMGLPVNGGPKPQRTVPVQGMPHDVARNRNGRAAIVRSNELAQKFKVHMIPNENDRNDVYLDSEGIPTVGIGHKVLSADGLKVGDRISDAQKEAFWKKDPAKALSAALQQMREAGISDPNFVVPLADVNFQLGVGWR